MNGSQGILNALSFDIEGFVESNVQSFAIPATYVNRHEEAYEIEANTSAIFELLDACDRKATFFFLASVVERVPDVVKTAAALGHEVGVHGPDHVRVFDLTRAEFAERLVATKCILEEVSGVPVIGFRAPDFSITEKSIWALDVLREAGFRYDSSVYPLAFHDVYGIAGAEPYVHRLANGLVEFPLSTIGLLGKRWPFGGGGYFRFAPIAVTSWLVRRTNTLGHPANVYMHPYEVGPIIPDIPTAPFQRRLRHYHNCRHGGTRLRRLMARHAFGPIAEVLARTGWI